MASQGNESRHSNISVDPIGDGGDIPHHAPTPLKPFEHQYSLESKNSPVFGHPVAASGRRQSLDALDKRHSLDVGEPRHPWLPPSRYTSYTEVQHHSSDSNLAYLSHPIVNTEKRATALMSVDQHQSAVKTLVNQTEHLKVSKKIVEQERDSLQAEKDWLHNDKVKMHDQATQSFEISRNLNIRLKESDEKLKILHDNDRANTRRYSALLYDYDRVVQENCELKDALKNSRCSSCFELQRQLDDEKKEKERIKRESEDIKKVNRTLQDEVENLKKQLEAKNKRK